ncbi:MAG: MFS transporter [Porphyrobacter sp.]|nr:MFS transporter [Porphyrobacter sp.]
MASSPATADNRFDVAAFIDAQAIGWGEIAMLVVCSIVLFIDGFDMYFLGKIAPAVARGLGGKPVDMTMVFTWQQIGMAAGAFTMPPLADRIGRKPMLVVCLLGFGLLSLAGAFATSLLQLTVLRGLAGVFLAGAFPIGLTLLSEMTPQRMRAPFMSISLVFLSGGNIASGAVAAWLLDLYGWQVGFWLAGVLPLVALPLMLMVPESLAFRVSRDPVDPRIARTIRKVDPEVVFSGFERFRYGPDEPATVAAGPTAVLSRRYRLQTVILWATCFLSLGLIALLSNWLPTYFQELGGVPIQQFAKFLMIGFVGGAVGTLSMGWFMARTNPYWLICGFFVLDAVAIAALGWLPFGTGLFVGALLAWNFAQVGGQTGLNTLATLGYPPEMRSSGMGWASGVGRFGGILFPYLGGLALEAALPLNTLMLLIALPALLVAMLIAVLAFGEKGQAAAEGSPATA